MSELTELEREYSPSTRVDDVAPHLARYAADSARARAELPVHRDLPCGPLPEWTLDFFPAPRADAPLFVFVHGGYWQELSKDESAFAAPGLLAAGVSFAALGYGLAPRYTLREITAATGEAIRRICTEPGLLPGLPGGAAPREVHLAGHSAGAHLVASALTDTASWRRCGARPADAIASATLISGVYDVRPLRHTYVNDALGMGEEEARACSPLLRLGVGVEERLPELVLALGENETNAFARQQRDFADAARRAAGARVTELVVPGRHHFDLPFDLGDPATPLGAEVTRLITPKPQAVAR